MEKLANKKHKICDLLVMINRAALHTPQSGRNTPNEGFFDSKHFAELDHIQRREQQLSREATEREEHLKAERRRAEEEKRRAQDKSRDGGSEVRTPCEYCLKAETRPARRYDGSAFKALRRPLAPRCTCMDPTNGALPVLPIEYPVDIDDWAYKPFSTIAGGGAVGYRDLFPLLMQRCTEAEEKDNTQVQTETRRHSIVTTDYLTGRIKLLGTGGEHLHMKVFPVLHAVVSSDEEDDEEEEASSGEDQDEQATHDEALRSLRTDHAMAVPRRKSIQSPPFQQRRRSSLILGGSPVGRGPPGAAAKVIRRRSIDQSSLALSFARALEAASDAMAPISEDQEARSETLDTDFDVQHAEETMIHLAQNLQTLEEFLEGASSTSSISDANSDDDVF
ncbi:uncharacterized protein LOC119740368 [Patiria miniata]|uniref:Uncharacterized protein n=1 Tax=Patiria miniata TaxID=46514 RepID=A0A914B5P8_PATMI|nr:uncharacterized protein LOC119740368 [Patiria miniata]